jgi:hypothetical protein
MSKCVGSGHCCRVPCAYGKYNEDKTHCIYLEKIKNVYDTTIYKCGRYEEIKRIAPDWELYPAFGAGCCQPIANENRQKILSLVRKGYINIHVHNDK